ncbi:MAG: hypothetical protein FIB04_00965 [Gammaproteobacteria bacterium]|nr:hypothetical protein [Gammaproteobacteria bacterium]
MDLASKQPFRQWRFLQLTIVMVAWMLLSPVLEARWSGHLAMQVLLLNLMLVTLWANPRWRIGRLVVAALWLLSVVASMVSVFGITQRWVQIDRTVDIALVVPVSIACAVGVLAFAFRSRRPTLDGVFAMVVVYFLIAMIFAELYYLALVWNPDALHLLKPTAELSPRELRSQLLYYSLVTLSTVGYGDILPTSPTMRMLAGIEAVTGQFFVAVAVALFVGMWAAHATMGAREKWSSKDDSKD